MPGLHLQIDVADAQTKYAQAKNELRVAIGQAPQGARCATGAMGIRATAANGGGSRLFPIPNFFTAGVMNTPLIYDVRTCDGNERA